MPEAGGVRHTLQSRTTWNRCSVSDKLVLAFHAIPSFQRETGPPESATGVCHMHAYSC